MYIETKKLMTKFCFVNVVIACVLILVCGSLTASQKTAYNIYLREYSVLTMKNSTERINFDFDGESYSLALPDDIEEERLRRCLKLTPFATVIFFAENIAELAERNILLF